MVRSGSSRTRFVVTIVVLSSLTLLAAGRSLASFRGQARDAVAPLRTTGKSLTKPIDRLIASMSTDQLRSDNARLRHELDKSKVAETRFQDAVRQRKDLLALLKLRDPDGFQSVNARVVDRDSGNFDDQIELDVGADRGIINGATVVTGAGLVGRVVGVTPKHATVLLVSDPLSSVGVRLSTTGDVGVAKGSVDGEPMRVDLISLDTHVKKGDVFVTSGLQRSAFPPGIPVGVVRTSKPGAIQAEITMLPVVDLLHLEFVRVLISPPPAGGG